MRASDGVEAGFTFAMDEFSQPFTQPTIPFTSHATSAVVSPVGGFLHLLPAFLAALWLCGFLAVICVWALRWRRMSDAMREAAPLDEGREVEMLRRLERAEGIRKRIGIVLSGASLGAGDIRNRTPGFGVARKNFGAAR